MNIATTCLKYSRRFRRANTCAERLAIVQQVVADDSLPLHLRESFADWAENARPLRDGQEQIKWAQRRSVRAPSRQTPPAGHGLAPSAG